MWRFCQLKCFLEGFYRWKRERNYAKMVNWKQWHNYSFESEHVTLRTMQKIVHDVVRQLSTQNCYRDTSYHKQFLALAHLTQSNLPPLATNNLSPYDILSHQKRYVTVTFLNTKGMLPLHLPRLPAICFVIITIIISPTLSFTVNSFTRKHFWPHSTSTDFCLLPRMTLPRHFSTCELAQQIFSLQRLSASRESTIHLRSELPEEQNRA